jgi:hypothetical protein
MSLSSELTRRASHGDDDGNTLLWIALLLIPLAFAPRTAGWIYIFLLAALVRGCTGVPYLF